MDFTNSLHYLILFSPKLLWRGATLFPNVPMFITRKWWSWKVSPGRWDSESSASLCISSDRPVKAYFLQCWGVEVSGIQHIRRLHFFSLIKFRTSSRASPVALVVKNLSANAEDIRKHSFDPWIGKIPWQQPSAVFLPGESHGQRSLAGYSP